MSILIIGSSNTDLVIRADRFPKPGQTLLGGQFFTNPGGKGANQAVGASRLGADVTFCCMTGMDSNGDTAISQFDKEGIDTSYVFRTPLASSGIAVIGIDGKGENRIIVASGANAFLTPECIDKIDFAKFSIVLCQLETPLPTVEAAAHYAHNNGCLFVLNPAPACQLPEALLQNIDIITPNETEAEVLTGINIVDEKTAEAAAVKLCSYGIKSVIITLGGKGAYVYSDSFRGIVPAFKVKPVDTTAAGDIFNAALCVAISESSGIEEAVRFAQAAASISVTREGAQKSAPTRDEVIEVISNKR